MVYPSSRHLAALPGLILCAVLGTIFPPVMAMESLVTQAFESESKLAQVRDDHEAKQAEADRLYGEAVQIWRTSQWQDALERFEQALVLYREVGDCQGEGRTLNGLGKIADDFGDYPQALGYYQQALRIRRAIGDRAGASVTLNNIGSTYSKLGDYPQALDYYQQALGIMREIDDRARKRATLNNIGLTYSQLGDYPQALDYYQQALRIMREIGDRAGEGVTLNNIGSIYDSLGDYPQSLDYYQQALGISREIGDRAGEGATLTNIGASYRKLGDYPQALDYYQQALGISRAIGDRGGEGTTLNHIGATYSKLGDYPQALEYYQQALGIMREISDRAGEGRTLTSVGLIYSKLGDYLQALDYYQRSLGISHEIGDRAGEGTTLSNIGATFSKLGDYPQALDYYQQSLGISHEIGNRAGEGTTLSNIGDIYRKLGDYPQALDYAQQSLGIRREIGDHAGEGITLNNIGWILEQTDEPELAIAFLKQSVTTFEKIRQTNQKLSQELQQSYTDTIASTYRKLADLLLQHDRILEAQRVLDLLKVQELDEYLQEVRRSDPEAEAITNRAPEQTIQDEFDALLNDVIAITQRLRELEEIPTLTADQETELIELSKQAHQLIQAFNTFWDSDSVQAQVALLRQTTDGESIDLSNYRDLQASLTALDQNAVLLYPFVLDDRLELVLVTPEADTPIRKTVPVERLELNTAIANYRSALENNRSNPLPLAQKLHGWLLEPFADELEDLDVETIIYAPDGQLRYIPLAALHDGSQWAVEQYRINNITAASLMDITLLPKREPKVFAAAFTEGRHTVPVGDRSLTFDGLTYAGREVENLTTLLPNTTKRLNDEFNPDTVYQMNRYNIVHLATHASFVPENAHQSFILFGDGTPVTLPNVREWRLPDVDLVVLSACETGVGDELGDGREILGLGYQMQKAGAKAAIASLWRVSDGGTQTLMDAFYTALNNGHGKAEALRRAQQALITGDETVLAGERGVAIELIDTRTGHPLSQSSGLSHPYYWAPFILIGNGL